MINRSATFHVYRFLAFSLFYTVGHITYAAVTEQSSSPLNDTGVTAKQCYQSGSIMLVSCVNAKAKLLNKSQDGMIGRDTKIVANNKKDGLLGFSFTKISSIGAILPVMATNWACIKDNVTGLIWENKTNDFGLHDGANTYTHFDSKTQMNKKTDVGSFITTVNQQKLCGANDWQLPSAKELQSIVDYGAPYPGPTVDSAFFPNTQKLSYWVAEPFVGKTDDHSKHGWIVTFNVGFVDDSNLKWSSAVRLVRHPTKKTPVNRYVLTADGQEVKDGQTQLIWRRCVEGMKWSSNTCVGKAIAMTHEAALHQATSQSSRVAWRLPNIKELLSIIDNTHALPAINSKIFPATPSENFWSSSPNVVNLKVNSAWYVAFDDGDVNDDLRSNTFMVRLVRDSK